MPRRAYLYCMRDVVRYFRCPPDALTLEHLHQYQLHLTRERKLSWSTFNQHVCARRFFYRVTLQKDWNIQLIPYQKTGRHLPEILSPTEVIVLFEAVKNFKHRALLMTVYAAGLRLQEVIHRRVHDLDSRRMLIRIEQGKGRKDRDVMLSVQLLTVLREYWRRYRPRTWLFPSRDPDRPIAARTVQAIVTRAQVAAGLQKHVTVHSLRHAFATHVLEGGTNLRIIQLLVGHRSLSTTHVYTRVATSALEETRSPLDLLPELPPPAAQRDPAWTAQPGR